uniref:RNA-editing substrate-binding complex 7 protein domain-containing protein n=1 Tax=Trypanosoma congolense (strain IL3000) TaxID=1068625 RepID=G0UNT4_TRYCI|nr:conserved hypothetical protein [Trypanosoma congolense IL3000]
MERPDAKEKSFLPHTPNRHRQCNPPRQSGCVAVASTLRRSARSSFLFLRRGVPIHSIVFFFLSVRFPVGEMVLKRNCAHLLCPVGAAALRRCTSHTVRRFKSTTVDTNASTEAAKALFSMERYHRQSPNENERRQVERQAWEELMKLPDAAVEDASPSDIADILGSWCYFSKYWENGLQGPKQSEAAETDTLRVTIPLIDREKQRAYPLSRADCTPPPRANPLDEMLEF